MDGAVNTTFSLICCTTRMIGCGATMHPTRQPVITKSFEKLFSVIVRSAMPGRLANGTNGCW